MRFTVNQVVAMSMAVIGMISSGASTQAQEKKTTAREVVAEIQEGSGGAVE